MTGCYTDRPSFVTMPGILRYTRQVSNSRHVSVNYEPKMSASHFTHPNIPKQRYSLYDLLFAFHMNPKKNMLTRFINILPHLQDEEFSL